MRSSALSWILLAFASAVCAAAGGAEWSVDSPPGERRDVPIDVRTGTWLSVDVSPDGKRVAFDLLGDLYETPIEGGEARALTSGLSWDMQPRYSPDGAHVAFTSDRAGGDNIWIVGVDGGAPRQITKEDFRLLNNPAWHPQGRYVAARKHYTTRRSLGTGELWLYSLDGGDGVQLVKRPSEEYQKELGEPAFSADGRYLYYTQNSSPGATFEYAQDVNKAIFTIRRYEMAGGKIDTAVEGPGGAVRPTPSPDGRWLAYVRRLRTDDAFETALFLKDLRTGEERPLYTDLDRDMQETWAVHGVYPNMDWTPDSREIVFWAGGGIKRIDVDARTVRDIPFHVAGSRASIAPPRFPVDVAPERVQAKMIRFAGAAPDGKRVVFEAFGRLWLRDVQGGEARALTRDDSGAFELYPSWSRDGKQIVFVRWTDAGLGEIHVVAGAGGRSRKVTANPGHYLTPRFSPDARTIVFERSTGGQLTSPLWSMDPGVYLIPTAGGEAKRLTDKGRNPHFGAASDRVYLTEDAQPAKESEPAHELVSVDLNGKDRRVHAKSHYAARMDVSPDSAWIAFRENHHIYVAALPPAGAVELSTKMKSVPMRRASDVGGDFPSWVDGGRLTWTVGPELHEAQMQALFAPVADEAKARGGQRIATLEIAQQADAPRGVVALTNARIVTMNEAERVIDNGVIVIRDNRIVAVGAAGETSIPADARRLDLGGRSVTPGLIDIHAHGPQGVNDIVPQQNWSALAHLALGVTTVHDPSNQASEIFAAAEYQRTGKILAPRIFSTGEVIYGARSENFASVDTIEDARKHVQRLKAQGAISVKNYNQPRREQRQMVVAAAREAGLMVVAEGGSLYHMDANIIADGNTGLEHNMPPERFYDDVLQFWPATGVGYTPTLVVTFGGMRAEDWFYQEGEVWKHPILSRYVPPHILQPRAVRRQMAPESDHVGFRDSAANAKRLMERGVLVNIGAHGQREGLGSHWEIWSFALGGMTPMQALKAATINPARYMGFARDLGSIEPGKLADLLVLDGDPLEDIRVTDDIAYVILNGRVYEGGALKETVTGERQLAPFYWQGR
jgi:imidazolonepropionase-like amidohydrolase/Tol biopolymer transport system component